MAKHSRVALFMDYENFYASLIQRFAAKGGGDSTAGRIDFTALVDYVRAHYGSLSPADFLATANFSHYDRQKGGLNQVATLVAVDSFEARPVRNKEQPTPGKKFVVRDYTDMRLAYEIGRHVAAAPADLYILASGDKAFAAVGQALRSQGFPVIFLLSNPDHAAVIIKESFTWVDFMDSQKATPAELPSPKEAQHAEPVHTQVDALCELISRVRQEFRTAVPLTLVKAAFGSQAGMQLLQSAQSQGRVDLWDTPAGTACVSRREERMFNKVVPMAVRADFLERADQLYAVVRVAENGLKEPTRAEWRRALKEQGRLSVRDAKEMLNDLFARGILQDGSLERVNLPLEKVLAFLQNQAASG